MKKASKIYIAGHRGLVGSALLRVLQKKGYTNIICKTHKELDLTDQAATAKFFAKEKPEYVFLAAAKVGGIHANNAYPADFIYKNIQIQNNIIHNSYLNKVKKLLFLGSSCIYPKLAPNPIKEEYLLSGKLEPTNEPYALAKIAGIKMCQSYNRQHGTNFIAAMPCNLYGIGDNFDLNNSHVLPALIRKFHEAKIENKKEVIVWGTGIARREFLFADDMAEACILMMDKFNPNAEQNELGDVFMNIGASKDQTIKQITQSIKKITGFKGKITWDTTKSDGTLKKLMNSTKIKKAGWKQKTNLEQGLRIVYKKYIEEYKKNDQ